VGSGAVGRSSSNGGDESMLGGGWPEDKEREGGGEEERDVICQLQARSTSQLVYDSISVYLSVPAW
jgi:hypothetical protein